MLLKLIKKSLKKKIYDSLEVETKLDLMEIELKEKIQKINLRTIEMIKSREKIADILKTLKDGSKMKESVQQAYNKLVSQIDKEKQKVAEGNQAIKDLEAKRAEVLARIQVAEAIKDAVGNLPAFDDRDLGLNAFFTDMEKLCRDIEIDSSAWVELSEFKEATTKSDAEYQAKAEAEMKV